MASAEEEMRAEFEKWVTKMEPAYAHENLERLTGGHGGYKVHNVACWWFAWQAATASALRWAAATLCIGCRNDWPTQGVIPRFHHDPASGGIIVCRAGTILSGLPETNSVSMADAGPDSEFGSAGPVQSLLPESAKEPK